MDLIFNVFKENDYLSFDIIKRVRTLFNLKKAGYTGTLDPFASGVLPVFTGNFTKLIPFVNKEEKEYRFNIVFGYETDTLDITGKIVEKSSFDIDIEQLKYVLEKQFIGNIKQIPPVFSAIKINGKPAYMYAKQNRSITMKSRNVKVNSIKIEEFYKNGFIGTVNVKSGFYVRSFARDIGRALNTRATLIQLERLKDGMFDIDNAKSIEKIDIVDSYDVVELMVNYMNIRFMEYRNIKKLTQGQIIVDNTLNNGDYLIMDKEKHHIVICNVKDNIVKPRRMIR